MPYFEYVGRDMEGRKVAGRRQSLSAEYLASELDSERVIPVQIRPIEESAMARYVRGQGGLAGRLRQLSGMDQVLPNELIVFCRQMYSLSRAGVPIVRAIEGLAEASTNPYFAQLLRGIRDDLSGGSALAVALAAHPHVFNPLFISMINVGENTGQLDEAFQQLSSHLELERETRKRIKQATRYPTFVMVAMAIALTVINLMVIPAFAGIFAQFKAELPLPTLILIGFSEFMQRWWWLLGLSGVAAGVAFSRWTQTVNGRLVWDRYKLKIPIVGRIFERIALARFTRTFAMMYRAGLPLLQVLDITSSAVGNKHIGRAITGIRTGVERGEPLTRGAAASGLFTPLVLQMMAVGEETGALDDLFLEVAHYYDQEVDYDLKRMADSIEPILLVVMGAMVLMLALGIFLPMWDLASAARG